MVSVATFVPGPCATLPLHRLDRAVELIDEAVAAGPNLSTALAAANQKPASV